MPRAFRRRTRQPQEGAQRRRVPVPQWVNPFWGILGSSIELMVLEEFVRRGIYVEHVPQQNKLGGFVDPSWEADFWLPQYNMWIEIQGSYFHSLPGQIETDAYRFAALEAAGVRVLAWWEYDIRSRLKELFDAVPEFYNVDPARQRGYRVTPGYTFLEGGEGIDHLAGLRKALAGRRKPEQTQFRVADRIKHERERRRAKRQRALEGNR
jgi:very-short-patch-repair endonuclease